VTDLGALVAPSPRQRRQRGTGRIYKRGDIYWLAYSVAGQETRESAHTRSFQEAEAFLRKRLLEKSVMVQTWRSLRTGLERFRQTALLTGAEILAMRNPLVYAWFRGDEALYVGKGETGLSRPLSPAHHQLKGILPDDRIRIWSCQTATEAVQLELALIDKLQPLLNRQFGPKGKAR
jgi:hypothetical protein